MFETFEEDGSFFVRGNVYVIAVLDRDTLKLRYYLSTVFEDLDEAEDLIQQNSITSPDLAFVAQQKEVITQIYHAEN